MLFSVVISFNILTIISASLLICFLIIERTTRNQLLPFYGCLGASVVFQEHGITLDGKEYRYTTMQDFSISLRTFDKDGAIEFSKHPGYFNGVDNDLFFLSEGDIVHERFLIRSRTEFDVIQKIIDCAVVGGHLPLRKSYLELVSASYQQSDEYKHFIRKLKDKNS